MKHIIFIIVCFTMLSGASFAQDLESSNMTGGKQGADATTKDTGKPLKQVKSVINVWTLDNQYSTIKPSSIDSSTINFHIYNPMLQNSISNTFLGFAGSAFQSNIFSQRNRDAEFYFLKYSEVYRRSQNEVQYFNTTTPFASLMYVQGQNTTNRKEQVFRAFFTQNIDSITNFGFRFNTIANNSQYQQLGGGHKFLNVFASRNGKRYNGYFNLINGTDKSNENGGIRDSANIGRDISAFIRGYSPFSLPVRFNDDMESNVKSLSIFTSHEYLMGKIPNLFKPDADTVNTEFVPRYSIQYSAEFNKYNRSLIESSINTTFFDTAYINISGAHTDSSSFSKFSHVIQLKALESNERKFTFGKRVFLENEIVSASHPLRFGERTYTYGNLFAGGEIYSSSSDFWQWSALTRFAILGRNIGDAIVKGTVVKPFVIFNDTTLLKAEGWYQDISPDIYQEHWFSNHFKWENKFKKQHEVVIKGEYNYPRFRLSGGANYMMMSNFFYHNEQALPSQYDNEFSVFSGWLNKDFVLGRFGWSNKVVWQELSSDAVLHLPVWSAYSSIYYSHYLFKVMKIQMGAEMYYHTKFYADSYEPSISQFYLQNKVKTGGYPQINLYANAKLKRTSAFVVLTNANCMFNFGDFFSSPSYPLEQLAFRFGFFWTFYD